ncbi:50S ribosomal protein L14 [Lyticum sinuosum]|uniref:Large ribosomal subunit protein uL14 n=1 Tax=Lyticum sinuosum TaxID=1332059 RepID=A0AAE4VKG7_9RICK|nr:50S ribosomal protein L14 [Lyticum sinuosum]MDZ5761180.1 50S ribosomal protein L14 [Lyticum sinuosum]
MCVIKGTLLNVADNTGVHKVKCIDVIRSGDSASVGDLVVVSIRDCSPTSKVKSGSVCRGVLVRTVKEKRRTDGSYIKFDDNAVVLISKDNQPIGTRVFGPVAREVKHAKIVSLAPEVI